MEEKDVSQLEPLTRGASPYPPEQQMPMPMPVQQQPPYPTGDMMPQPSAVTMQPVTAPMPPPYTPHVSTAPVPVPTVTPQATTIVHHHPVAMQDTVVVVTPAHTIINTSNPVHMTCPYCRRQITTNTKSELRQGMSLPACLLCLFGCWCCACLLCCLDKYKQTTHYCPNCRAQLGTYLQG